MFLLGISENKATRKEFAIYRSNVVVPTGPGFFSLKTFCFAKMTSRVFNIVLEGSFQRSCYEPGSTILKTRDFIEAKLKVWGDKKKSGSFGAKCWGKLIPQRWNMLQKKRENIIFLLLEKVFKIKPGWKARSRNPGKKVGKKTFFPTWLWSDFGK